MHVHRPIGVSGFKMDHIQIASPKERLISFQHGKIFLERQVTTVSPPRKKKRGGSAPGRAPDRDRVASHARLIVNYFAPDPVFNSTLLRRRFRMPPVVFDKILDGVVQSDDYFVQKYDAHDARGISPHQKGTAALRMFCYGVAANSTDECLLISESSAMESFKRFTEALGK
ncbi:hypothetical protein PC111_g15522 [Phytophthora cactorum]|nr:hypothetical protein PC111_g15522 [Phytophthora cactorum]